MQEELEVWKDIPNYDGVYQASNLGNIRVTIFRNNVCEKRKIKNLKLQIDKYGRKRVMLHKNKKNKLYQVHTLIAETFLKKELFKSMPYEDNTIIDVNKLEVNHIDENPLNNNVNNLEWCTRSYNMNYGTMRKRIAEKKIIKKVEQLDLNNKLIKKWNSVFEITKKMGISKQCISYCCNNKTKTAKGYIWRYVNE